MLALKAGERYRLHRWRSSGAGSADWVERTHIQMQAGLDLVGAGLQDRSVQELRQELCFGHADIAAVCAARFAPAIGNLVGKPCTDRPGLKTELMLREDQPGFRSTSTL